MVRKDLLNICHQRKRFTGSPDPARTRWFNHLLNFIFRPRFQTSTP